MKRSKWKGPFIKAKFSDTTLPILPRDYEVNSKIIGLTCNVYSGRKLVKLSFTDEMVGYKVGEFVPTRAKFNFKKNNK